MRTLIIRCAFAEQWEGNTEYPAEITLPDVAPLDFSIGSLCNGYVDFERRVGGDRKKEAVEIQIIDVNFTKCV